MEAAATKKIAMAREIATSESVARIADAVERTPLEICEVTLREVVAVTDAARGFVFEVRDSDGFFIPYVGLVERGNSGTGTLPPKRNIADFGVWGERMLQGMPTVVNSISAEHPLVTKSVLDGKKTLRMMSVTAGSVSSGRLVFVLLDKVSEFDDNDVQNARRLCELGWALSKFPKKVRELEDQYLREQLASQAKSQLLVNASHELRTSLTGIFASLDLLGLEFATPSLMAEVAALRLSSERMLETVNNILYLSDIDLGAEEVLFEQVVVRDLVKDLVTKLQERCLERGLVFKVSCGLDVPTVIDSNKERLERALGGVLDFVISATREGEIELKVYPILRQKISGDLRPQLAFEISDTNSQRFCASPSSEIDSDGSDKQIDMLGVGVAVCQRIVEKLGGELEWHREVNRGNVFLIVVNGI